MVLPAEKHRELLIKTILFLAAVSLNVIEFFIPRIPLFPWLKPGIANCVTIIWLLRYGYLDTLLFSFLRIWIVNFYFGFSFINTLLAFSGAFCASTAMSLTVAFGSVTGLVGLIGVSVVGALFHNLGQIGAVYGTIARNTTLFYQIPVMFIVSAFSGSLVGYAASLVRNALQTLPLDNTGNQFYNQEFDRDLTHQNYWYSLGLFLFCISLAFITNIPVLLVLTVLCTSIVQLAKKGSLSTLLFPVRRGWMLFLFIAILHLFYTHGTYMQSVPFVTYEGLELAGIHWLRLWIWMQATFLFSLTQFPAVLLKVLHIFFPAHQETVAAAVEALRFFPSIAGKSRQSRKSFLRALRSNPSQTITVLFTSLADTITADTDS